MQIFRHHPPLAMRHQRVLTIGNFDGVHLGHQAVLAKLKAHALALNLPSTVLTFDPHPREYFASFASVANIANIANGSRSKAPLRINSLRDKACALAAEGVNELLVAHFNQSMAAMSAEAFIEEFLVGILRIKYLLVGDDFQFGAKRLGNFAMLESRAAQFGYRVEQLPTLMLNGHRVSSSLVREAVAKADFKLAQTLLNRPYAISGKVICGRQLGRTLGFPTLNMRVPGASESGNAPLLSGVFAVRVKHLKQNGTTRTSYNGVASLGTRPAVEQNGRYLLETHVFDFAGDAYGQTVSIEFVAKLRDEANYDSLEALTKQINLDAEQAKTILLEQSQQTTDSFI
jgi:riboflavin kinase / FMN adenylyltransferase